MLFHHALKDFFYTKHTKFLDYLSGFESFLSTGIPLNYYVVNNAGDSFNNLFLKQWLDLPVCKYSFGNIDHLLFCGSILSRSNLNSHILGAGFISEDETKINISFKKVYGVRGQLSLDALSNNGILPGVDFLGDPGLLAREVVIPNRDLINGPTGVIPHYVDWNTALNLIGHDQKFKLIDIRQNFVHVCEEILKCSNIVSSSLHGLVFSDSMNVPNQWISFGGKVKGGRFKFDDYYSVMTKPKNHFTFCDSILKIESAASTCWVSSNPNYDRMKSSVLKVIEEWS